MVRVIISIGYGRLHLVNSAKSLVAEGCKVRMICGWVPKNPNGWKVQLCSKLIGRDLSTGMEKRAISYPNMEICTLPVVDFFDQGLRLVDSKVFHGKFKKSASAFSWRVFGWVSSSCLNVRNPQRLYSIFHVRSGAGQGGAIKRARQLGMKVVVDHSIAHPAFMDRHLRQDYERNGAPFDLGMDSPFWRQIVKDCEDADVLLVNSFFVRDTFMAEGFNPEKIKVVYLGQREDFFGLRKQKFEPLNALNNREPIKLLFTGGFGFRKGGEYILEALKLLKQRGVAFEMDIVGDYSSAGKLISRYEKDFTITYANSSYALPFSNAIIRFHGPKPQEELKTFLAEDDIYVFPSLAEGCAQSGMEAMSAGMCVIGTRESGFPITDGENGFLVPSKNAVAIADRIEWLNANRREIDRIGANAATLVQTHYTWQKYAENVKDIYEECLRQES